MPNDMSFDLKSVKCMTECVCVFAHWQTPSMGSDISTHITVVIDAFIQNNVKNIFEEQ